MSTSHEYRNLAGQLERARAGLEFAREQVARADERYKNESWQAAMMACRPGVGPAHHYQTHAPRQLITIRQEAMLAFDGFSAAVEYLEKALQSPEMVALAATVAAEDAAAESARAEAAAEAIRERETAREAERKRILDRKRIEDEHDKRARVPFGVI